MRKSDNAVIDNATIDIGRPAPYLRLCLVPADAPRRPRLGTACLASPYGPPALLVWLGQQRVLAVVAVFTAAPGSTLA